jgi:FkbM family methyltransferase
LKVLISRSPRAYRWSRITLNLARFLRGRPHEIDFEYLRWHPVRGLLLDVGANNGMSALSLRLVDRTSSILSIEPSELIARDLGIIARLIPNFEYRVIAAGSREGEFLLYTPCYGGLPITGEASLHPPRPGQIDWIRRQVRRFDPSKFAVLEQRVRTVPLDSLALRPAFIKIDVEGAELEVLRGLRRTLAECRPLILIETSDEFEHVRKFLAERAYEPFVYSPVRRDLVRYDERFAEDLNAMNVFFRPETPN